MPCQEPGPDGDPGVRAGVAGKGALTIWEDPYHFHSSWTPVNASHPDGSVASLSVDVFVYDDRSDALAWLRAFEADSDGPLAIGGINTTYRFRGRVAEVAFMTGDVLVHTSAVAGSAPAGRRRYGRRR